MSRRFQPAMKFSFPLTALLLLAAAALASAREPWVSAYYPGWESKKLPPAQLPFDAFTHLFQFACTIRPDGTLDLEELGLSEELMRETVQIAHEHGKKVSIVLGGAANDAGFRGATSTEHRGAFIGNVIDLVEKFHYDGVDLDWEPMPEKDFVSFSALAEELRARLDQLGRPLLLSVATAPSYEAPQTPELFARLQARFDQVNVMTYGVSGAWDGWISWHGAPLTNGGGKFPGGRELPSIERNLALFTAAGVAPAKLGIGLPFHGDVWTGGAGTSTGGVTEPGQTWETAPTVKGDVAYAEIIAKYAATAAARYDDVAQTPYFSLDRPGSANDVFVSYCDAKAITARLNFMAAQGYGGCIIWQITQDRLPDRTHPLADAVARFRKNAVK